MGSGDRFKFYVMRDGVGLGIYFSRFPFAFSIGIVLIKFNIQIGIGKAYDKE